MAGKPMINWAVIGMTILKTIGQSLLTLLTTLLAGKTLKEILYLPIKWLADKTGKPAEEKIAEAVREDFHLEDDDKKKDTEGGGTNVTTRKE